MLAPIEQESGWLPYLIFESPGWLMAILAFCFAVTRIVGRRTGNPRLMHLSWISFGLIAALLAASYFVTTPREQINTALKDLLLAVEDKRLADVRSMIDEQAMTQFMGDELTLEQVMHKINAVEFDDIILLSSLVSLGPEPGYGSTIFRVNAKGAVAEFPGVNVSEWVIRWRLVDGRWVAVRLRCTAFGADAIFNRSDE